MKNKRKMVYVEFYSPWLCGGYSTSLVSGSNDLFEAIGFVISDDENVLILALGESNGNYLHEIRLPRSCIKKGTLVELPRPVLPCDEPNDKN